MTVERQLSHLRKRVGEKKKCSRKRCNKELNKINDKEFDNIRHNNKYEGAMLHKGNLKRPDLPAKLRRWTIKQIKKYKKELEVGRKKVSKKTLKNYKESNRKYNKCMKEKCGEFLIF